MIVELVGLPGVGKSFLCRSLQKFYDSTGDVGVQIVVEKQTTALGNLASVVAKLHRATRFTVMHPRTTGKLILAIFSKGSIRLNGRLSKIANLLSEADRSCRAPPSKLLISEQGVLQAVWSLEMRSDEPVYAELLEALCWCLPERVVFVEVDAKEYVSRLEGRNAGRSHFDRLQAGGLPEAMERGLQHTHEILDSWAVHIPGGDRLDFWNGQNVQIGDIADWVDRVCAMRS